MSASSVMYVISEYGHRITPKPRAQREARHVHARDGRPQSPRGRLAAQFGEHAGGGVDADRVDAPLQQFEQDPAVAAPQFEHAPAAGAAHRSA